jgi:hypothetical protein
MSARHALRAIICGLGGHELMRSFEPNRVCLRCTSCPYETPGWTLKENPRQQQAPRAFQAAALMTQSAR